MVRQLIANFNRSVLETDTIFILVTAAGTIFAVHVQPDGHAYAEQVFLLLLVDS